ncbi:MAG: putative metalloprotease CJM1_0395 family protein [Pseudomonadota bacterium]
MNASDLSLISSIPIASSKPSSAALSGETEKATSVKDSQPTTTAADSGSTGETKDPVQLSDKAKALVRSLQARDQQVRAHEQAHLAASGGLATSGASYTYQKGPDGVSYAIGGEVTIDVSGGSTPEETIARAAKIRAAALAPADPSGQDRAVAAAASQMEQRAFAQLLAIASQEAQAKLKSAYHPSTSPDNSASPNTRINEFA